ncbi:hypothetical protein ACQ4PT_049274 [Festuca glaucescens]
MGFISGEELVVMLAPVAVYWVYSGMYEALGSSKALDKYRLHSRRDEVTKNMASKKDVIKGVLLQQAIQAAISVAVLKLTGSEQDSGIDVKSPSSSSVTASYLDVAARFAVAMVVLDAWQYFMHRLMHSSRYMYRRFHSWHHRVVAPYAFAAQYNHPVDGVLTETLSGATAFLASGMSPRAAAAFFVFATVKASTTTAGCWRRGTRCTPCSGTTTRRTTTCTTSWAAGGATSRSPSSWSGTACWAPTRGTPWRSATTAGSRSRSPKITSSIRSCTT